MGFLLRRPLPILLRRFRSILLRRPLPILLMHFRPILLRRRGRHSGGRRLFALPDQRITRLVTVLLVVNIALLL